MAITILDTPQVSNDTSTPEKFTPSLVAEDDSFMADLARPAVEAEAKEKEELNAWRNDTLQKVDEATLNFDGFFPEKSPEVRRRMVVQAAIEAELGWSSSSSSQFEIDRPQAAMRIFGEDVGRTDESFVQALTKRATERKEERDFYGELRGQATISAIMGGQEIEVTFGEKAKGNPVFEKNQGKAIQQWKETRDAILDEYDEVLDEARSLNKIIKGGDVSLFDVADIVGFLDDEDLTKLASLLGKMEQIEGEKESDRGVWNNLLESTGRDAERFGDQQKGFLVDFFSKVAEGSLSEGEDITGIDNSEAIKAEQGRQERLERTQRFLAEVRRFRDQRDPIDFVTDDDSFWGRSFEKALYATPGVGMSVGMAIIPVVGMGATGVMLHESALDDYYLRAIDAGVDREESRELSREVSGTVAALQFFPDRIGVGVLTKRIPGLSNVLDKMNSKLVRVGGETLVRGGAETFTEEVQAIIQEAGNDALNELKEEIPGADWDAHWSNFGERNLVTFLSIAPYSAMGSMVHDRGVSKSIEFANEATEEELVASGHKRSVVQKFQKAETEQEKRDAFFEMVESQDPEREETKEAAKNLAALQEKVRETQEDARRLAISPGVRMAPDQEGYEVYDVNSGETMAQVDTAQEAAETVFSVFGIKESQRQAEFDEILSKFEAGRLDADQSGEMVEIESRTFTEADAMVELPGSDQRIQTERMLIEQRDGGTGEVTEEVMGEGASIAGVFIPAGQMGRKEAATKLFNGSSVLTLIHERGHAKRRKLMETGKWSRSQQIGSIKAFDSLLEESERYLKANFDQMTEYDQEVALDEAVAELAEVLALRTRKGGKSKMRGLINKNLSAMVRSRVPGAAQLSAFLKGLRDFFGLALKRAAVLKKAERDGKLNSAQIDALADMLVGTTPQEQFEAERDAVPTQMVDGKEVDTPFSIGRTQIETNDQTRSFPTKDGGVVGPASFSITAFHATPHKVDKFSTDYIGTGEGAQAYGWGIYAAESTDVVQSYFDKFNKRFEDGLFAGDQEIEFSNPDYDLLYDIMYYGADGVVENLNGQIDTLRKAGANDSNSVIQKAKENIDRVPELVEKYGGQENLELRKTRNANLYTVELKAEPEELLDWDKPLSEQSEKVRKAAEFFGLGQLERESPKYDNKLGWIKGERRLSDDLGSEVYSSLQEMKGGIQSASKALHREGIKGIRYLDGNSRADGEGSHNYVIFSDADIEIKEENGKPVETGPTFSISNINKISSNNKADKLGIARLIPKKYKGKKMLPIMADLLGIGSADGVPIEGGPGHPLLYHGTGVAWRSNKGAIVGILGMLKSRGVIWKDADGKRKALVSVFAMSQDAHQSNRNAFLSFIKVIEDAKVSPEVKQRLADYVREKSTTKAFHSKRLQNFPESWTSQELDAFAEELAFSERASFLKMMRQSGAKNIGVPDAETIVRQLRDDSYDKVSSGSMLSLIEVDVDRLEKGAKENTLNASDFGVPEHLSYDTVLPGKIVTHLRQPVAMEVAFKSMVRKMGEVSPKSRPDYLMQAKLPKSVPLEVLTAARIKDINQEQSGQTSIAKAKAYISALSGNWTTIDSKSQKGVADFVAAIDRNLYSETLTPMTDSEVKRKAKEGKMEVFGLQGFDVWFGLQTREDGGKELVSVVSNEHSTGGMLDLVMMKAIEEGATHLDCYAVKNDKMPNGLLPTLYRKHGWKPVASYSYDRQYLGETEAQRDAKEKALVESWKDQGWDRSLHGMPDVVEMTRESETSSSEELQQDAQGGLAESQVIETGYESEESSARNAEVSGSPVDLRESSRNAGRGGEWTPRKVSSFISELEAASGNRLKAWGITEGQRSDLLASLREGGNASFSITPAQDQAYFSAVESGDMETAQDMVEKAARAAGYEPVKKYHTSFESFDSFTPNGKGMIFLTPDFNWAKEWGEGAEEATTRELYTKTGNLFDYENQKHVEALSLELSLGAIGEDSIKDGGWERLEDKSTVEGIKRLGFDGLYVKEDGIKNLAVFSPNQIKSANTVTYDADGNVIPLSKRFDETRDEISYQIGDSRMLSRLAEDAKSRTKRPEARAQIFGDIARRLNEIRRDVAQTKKAFGKTYEQKPIVDPRTMKSLRKEAAFRQAMKLEELEDEILQREGQALQSGDIPTLKEMPIHGFIANVGKGLSGGAMESRSAFKKRTGRDPGAEYEGAEGLAGGLLYGGGRSPDQMAQELYSEGLINEDSPAAMWEALATERESVSTRKEDFKAAKAKLREAKTEAKKFADEWLAEEVEKQERDYNPQERTRRALVMYDAILKALPPELRGKMGGFVKLSKLKTDEARLNFLEGRMEKADDIIERWIKKEMTKEAKKLIKSGLASIETGEVDRGTKGPTVHRLFEVIDGVFRGDVEAEVALAGMLKEQEIREESGQMTAEWSGYYDVAPAIVEGFGEWKKQSAFEMTNAIENAAKFYDRGWLQTKIKAAKRAEMIEAAIENLKNGKTDEEIDEGITQAEEAIGALWDTTKGAGREFIDFEQFLISIFGRVKVVEQLVDREYESYRDREEMRVTREHEEADFYAGFFEGDRVKGYRYKHDLKTARVKVEPLGSKGAPTSMTKSQIIHWLMMYRQPDGRRHFEGDGKRWEFTPEFMEKLEEKLDDKDRAVMDYYSQQYAVEWEVVNPIHEEVRGTTLVKNEEYSPITVAARMTGLGALAGAATMDPLSGEQVGAMNATPSMFKRRSKSAVARPRVDGAIETFQIHKTQVEHWIATAELSRDLRALFGRREAREIVEASSGKTGLGQLQKWIEDIATQGIRDTSVGMAFWQWMDRSISRISRMALFGKISTIVIQASQVAGAAAQMPARKYMAKLTKAATGQLDLSSAWNSPYIQGRLADTLPMVRLAYSNAKTKKPTKLSFYSDKIGQAIGFSDAIFTAGTYAAIFDHVKEEIMEEQGLSGAKLEAAAHKEAGKRTERVAQPIRKARRSLIENRAQGNVALRAFFAFASEPRQKLGSAFWEMFHAVRNRDKVKNALVYGAGFAVVSTVIRAMIADLRDEGEDDEVFDEENWNAEKMMVKSMTDNFNGVPIVGPMAESGFLNLAKKVGFDTPPNFPNEGLMQDPTKAIPASQRLVTFESMENSHEFAKDVRKTLHAAGMVREEAATAAVFWNMVEEAIRVMPVVESD